MSNGQVMKNHKTEPGQINFYDMETQIQISAAEQEQNEKLALYAQLDCYPQRFLEEYLSERKARGAF